MDFVHCFVPDFQTYIYILKLKRKTITTNHFWVPGVSVSSSKPFLEDGYFIVACDATNVVQWLTLTLELFSDTALPPTPVLLVTLKHNSTAGPVISEKFQSRILAFGEFSSNDVSLVVNVTNVNCQDRGEYLCRVTTLDGLDYEGSGRVDMQGKRSACHVCLIAVHNVHWGENGKLFCNILRQWTYRKKIY